MRTETVGKNQAGQRLDKFLHKCLPQAGNGFLYKMLRKKNITLNGKRAEGKEILSLGDEISFFLSEETYAKFGGSTDGISNSSAYKNTSKASGLSPLHPQAASLTQYRSAYRELSGISVLYEDENTIILNKPAGILTQKAFPGDLSLNEWLIGYLLRSGAVSEKELATFRPSVCNRLDRNTSGIVLCGKSLAGSQALSRVIQNREIRKFYQTVCVGEIKEDKMIEGYLCKDHKSNRVFVSETQRGEGSLIKTAYHPLAVRDGFTLLEVELITGKPHQIRAHLASAAHPVIGDRKYGAEKWNCYFQNKFSLSNQLLHACRVVFQQTKEEALSSLDRQTITAPLPPLFTEIAEICFKGRS